MTPAPMTTRRFGTLSSSSAPVDETTTFSSISTPGSGVTSEPVAMTIVLRLDDLVRAVLRDDLDLARRGDAGRAEEGVDLVLLQEELDALDVAVDALVLEGHHRLQIELRLGDRDAHRGEVACAHPRIRCEACRSAFEGMQPMLRQVPPCVLRFSTTAVFSPSCAARMAQTYPPGPVPMTMRS